MVSKNTTRPSKTEPWPADHGEITLNLKPADRVLFRKVNPQGLPESVGSANVGKRCIVIIGHKEVEDLKESLDSGSIEMFTGKCVLIGEDDSIFTCTADTRGLLSSLGPYRAGKDITIILHLTPEEMTEKRAEELKELTKIKEEMDEYRAKIKQCEEELKWLDSRRYALENAPNED